MGTGLTPHSALITFELRSQANERLEPLIKERRFFEEIDIPTGLLVHGTITDVGQLRGMTTTTPIIANEQVSSYRLRDPQAGPV